ncbi:hypothetical protein K400107F7_07930 [Agathobaculum massiliense]
MGAPFKITDMLPQSDTSTKAKENRRISYYDLVPSADNFYSMQDIDELKAAIELAGRVLHNLVVVPQGNGKYKILSGHRRHRAIGELLNEGKDQYEFLPCAVVDDESDLARQTILIAANSQREKTAWDKLEEVRQMRDIARKTKERHGIPGRVRDLVAKSLNVSNSRIAKYDSILNNLIPSLLDEIKADKLPISTAYEISALPSDRQQASYDFYLNHGKLPSESAQSDVFQPNTQPSAPAPREPAPFNVFHRNTQAISEDVFQTNTPSAPAPSEPVPSDVFQSNTQQTPQQIFHANAPYKPLTQADIDKMHFDRVWIDYGMDEDGERSGEEGVVLYGKLYSIDTLDGAGLEDLLLDATGTGGDTLDNPSRNYTVYRCPPEENTDA